MSTFQVLSSNMRSVLIILDNAGQGRPPGGSGEAGP